MACERSNGPASLADWSVARRLLSSARLAQTSSVICTAIHFQRIALPDSLSVAWQPLITTTSNLHWPLRFPAFIRLSAGTQCSTTSWHASSTSAQGGVTLSALTIPRPRVPVPVHREGGAAPVTDGFYWKEQVSQGSHTLKHHSIITALWWLSCHDCGSHHPARLPLGSRRRCCSPPLQHRSAAYPGTSRTC